jgi:hypothetical protein
VVPLGAAQREQVPLALAAAPVLAARFARERHRS